MIEKITLEKLLDICKSAGLAAAQEDGYIELKLDDDLSATLMVNDDETNVSFCFIPNIDVRADDPEDLALANAINTAFFSDDDLPAFTVCIDIYDEDEEEDAMMLRSSLSLVGGVSEKCIASFIDDGIHAIDIVLDIIDGGEDVEDEDENED